MIQTRAFGRLEKKTVLDVCNVIVPTKLSLKKSIDTSLLDKAVYHFIKCQPNLCSSIKEINGEVRFVPLKDIKDYFEVLPSNFYWKDICLKYGKSLLREESGILTSLKVFFIPESSSSAYLIPVYIHGVADGTNGMTIVNDILQNYTKLSKGDSLMDSNFIPPPSVDEMAESALPSDMKDSLQQKYIEYHRNIYKNMNCIIPFEESEPPASEALYYTSSPDILRDLIKWCHQYGVTVGSTLMAAFHFGYAAFIFNTSPDAPDQLNICDNIPINLRDRVIKNIPWNCCNLSVTQMLLCTGVTRDTKFGDIAKEIRMKLVENFEISHKFHLFDFGVNEDVMNSSEYKSNFEKFGVSHHMCTSNMLRYPSSVHYDDFSIESIHCVGGLWLHKWDVMELMIYSTDRLNLSMIHRTGEKNEMRANNVFRDIQYIIENINKLGENFSLQTILDRV